MNTLHTMQHRTLALAGMCQAATLVTQVANQGHIDEASFHTSIQSIFSLDADNVPSIYGSIHALQLGLDTVTDLAKKTVDSNRKQHLQTIHYVVSLISLYRKLNRNKAMLSKLRERIKQTTRQVNHFHPTHATIIANLADIYTHTLSTFKYRIQVQGEPEQLNSPYQVNKIRALLLAGMRSTVLWRQLGGKAYQLIFMRKRYALTAKNMLADIK